MEWMVVGPLWALSLLAVASVGYIRGRRRPPVTTVGEAAGPLAGDPAALAAEEPNAVEVLGAGANDPVWTEVVGRLRFQDQCHKTLTLSIVTHLRSTTEPLTRDLVGIRAGVADLVGRVREHDRRMNSGEDLAWVESLGVGVKREMAEAARLTHSSHDAFGHHVAALRQGLETVLAISRQIEDLSQRINVLSINASIEAARAGVAGRGFKVIAGEVKTMAHETSSFLAQIEATVTSTQQLFAGIGSDLDAKRGEISAILARQETGFSSFQKAFTDQRAEFEGLYRAIIEFTDRLDGQVSRVSPVVQLHDITVQELENLALAASDAAEALAAQVTQAGAPGARAPDADRVRAWAAEVRRRLTTADELAALDAVLAQWGLAPAAAPAHKPGALELF